MTAMNDVFANLASLSFAVGSSTVEIWEPLQKVIRMKENKDLRKSVERCLVLTLLGKESRNILQVNNKYHLLYGVLAIVSRYTNGRID
jgi:hypothetical protein